MAWYEVHGHDGHVGNGKSRDNTIYIWAADAYFALLKYKEIPRVKSNKLPDISKISKEDGITLEQKIAKEGRISLTRAKEDYYLSPSTHEMVINS